MIASAEVFTDPPDVVLFESGLASVSRAVRRRRLELGTVRHCVRQALGELRYSPTPLLKGNGASPSGRRALSGDDPVRAIARRQSRSQMCTRSEPMPSRTTLCRAIS
jgi:hypothetical protein